MRIGITDSGVGGLSVCAELEARLRRTPIRQDLEILYLNAAIEDDYAYNTMPDRPTKLEAFDRFLQSVYEKYHPDLLFIACNTLSMLFEDPWFDRYRHLAIEGIVDAGTESILEAVASEGDATVIIFATPTTIEEAIYGRRLRANGVPAGRIVEQACPGLPDAISNDGSGRQARELLEKFVPAALAKTPGRPEKVLAFLGCTHYGYQAGQFEAVLGSLLPGFRILNPNFSAADRLLSRIDTRPGNGDLRIEFIARYVIPEIVVNSLSIYIGQKAPMTLSALQKATHLPELCGD